MTWTEPATWYANLASFYAAAAAFITDPDGNVLLVKPTYRDHWAFPGGYVDDGEYPHDACAREIQEELGISVVVGDLLVVDWAPPAGSDHARSSASRSTAGPLPTSTALLCQGRSWRTPPSTRPEGPNSVFPTMSLREFVRP